MKGLLEEISWSTAVLVPLLLCLLSPVVKWFGTNIKERANTYCSKLRFKKIRDRYCSNLRDFLDLLRTLDIDLSLESIYIDAKLERENAEELSEARSLNQTYTNLEEAIEVNDRVILLGEPGAGKTTCVRKLAIDVIENRQLKGYVPIYIWLNEYVKMEGDIWDCLEDYGFDLCYRRFLEDLLNEGRCVLLFDGLDEVLQTSKVTKKNREYHDVVTMINRLVKKYPKCKYVVTSRPTFKDINLYGFARFTLVRFGDEQIGSFVSKFLGSDDAVQRFKRDLDNKPQIRFLCTNPLFLTICANVFKQRGGLPSRVCTLTKDFVDIFIYKWDSSRNVYRTNLQSVVSYGDTEKRSLLKYLAFRIHSSGQKYVSKHEMLEMIKEYLPAQNIEASKNEEVLDIISSHHGLIKVIGNSTCFWHLTIQEYFTASYCFEHQLNDFVHVRMYNEWWRQVNVFYSFFGDSSAHIKDILGYEDPLFHTHVFLAADCLAESPAVETELRQKIEKDIMNIAMTNNVPLVRNLCQKALIRNFNSEIEEWALGLVSDRKQRRALQTLAGNVLLVSRTDQRYIDKIIAVINNQKTHLDVKSRLLSTLAEYGNDNAIRYILRTFTEDAHTKNDIALRLAAGRALIDSEPRSIEPYLTRFTDVNSKEEVYHRIIAMVIAKKFNPYPV